jgi:hypothetical protein
MSQRAGGGEASQQAFLRAFGPAKVSECGRTRIACHPVYEPGTVVIPLCLQNKVALVKL